MATRSQNVLSLSHLSALLLLVLLVLANVVFARTSVRVDLTEEIEKARDAKGEIDIAATMQKINTVIEGWVREHPEQWLWLHRRWR